MNATNMHSSAAVPESIYYARHFRLPGFSIATQEKLRSTRVLIVGVGGLGCPAALYLSGVGVGTIALCDADEVSATNLHRQVLFDVASIGRKKVDVAAERLRSVNPHIEIETIAKFADAKTLAELVTSYDLVLDGTDNFAAKYAINDACEAAGVPLVYGSIFQFEGQVSVFHYPTAESPAGFSYRDLYPDAPPAGLAQNCGEAGVIGVLPGVIGTMQANEAIKIITGLGETLSGHLMMFDALGPCMQRVKLSRRERRAPLGLEAGDLGTSYVNITFEELQERLGTTTPPVVIDVREKSERDVVSIGGRHIPLTQLPKRLAEIRADRDLVVYCKSGVRSAKAALYLRSVLPSLRIFNLDGGVDAAVGAGFVCAS